ncbi:MAG: Gfo/Idh/MocA family oxidoreductase [Oscillospiraceae bacterium]
MRYALIGCGRISVNHLRAALDNELGMVAVCDLIPERMENVLAKFNLQSDSGIKRFADYHSMLQSEHPDLVAIATESGYHAQIALDCMDNGCNVIIEKPMAMSVDDADSIICKAKETGLKVCACHQNRFNLAVQELRKAIERGSFGKLSHGSVNVRWNRNREYYEQAPWRGTWAEDGGALMNQCIHGIDLLRWMMGDEIDEIYGQTRRRQHDYLEAEDIGMAVIKFKNGAIATVEGTTNVYPKNLEETLMIFGENGTVKLGGKSVNSIDVWDFKDEQESKQGLVEQTNNVYGNGHTPLYADVIDAIKNNRKPYVDECAGKRALETVLSIYKSQKTGLPVKLPLENFSTLDMKDEFDG